MKTRSAQPRATAASHIDPSPTSGPTVALVPAPPDLVRPRAFLLQVLPLRTRRRAHE